MAAIFISVEWLFWRLFGLRVLQNNFLVPGGGRSPLDRLRFDQLAGICSVGFNSLLTPFESSPFPLDLSCCSLGDERIPIGSDSALFSSVLWAQSSIAVSNVMLVSAGSRCDFRWRRTPRRRKHLDTEPFHLSVRFGKFATQRKALRFPRS